MLPVVRVLCSALMCCVCCVVRVLLCCMCVRMRVCLCPPAHSPKLEEALRASRAGTLDMSTVPPSQTEP